MVSGAEQYTLIAPGRLENIEAEGEEGEKEFIEDGTTIKLYRRIGTLGGINTTGEYHVDVEVKAGVNS